MAFPSGTSRSRHLILALAAALLGAGTACAPLQQFVVGEEEDRPPIIVSSGSVTITAEPDPKFNHRGFFSVEQQGSRWKHLHPNADTVAFEVTVTGSSSCTTAVRTTELEVRFDVGGQHKKLTIDVDQGDLRIRANSPFIRNLGEPHILQNESAALISVEIDGHGGCTFDSASRSIKIAQKRQ